MSLEDMVRSAVGSDLTDEQVDEVAASSGTDRAGAFNAIMVCLADLFLRGELGFWDADDVANSVWPLMLDHATARDVAFPSPAYEIYEAFDAGEWDHGDKEQDPVEKFTRPLLREILENRSSGDAGGTG